MVIRVSQGEEGGEGELVEMAFRKFRMDCQKARLDG